MAPAALDALLSRACAHGSRLDYVLERMNGTIPVIVAWDYNGRKAMCGPWSSLTDCAEVWAVFAAWSVFDYQIHELNDFDCKETMLPPFIVTLDLKEYERRGDSGKGQAH